MMARNAVAGVHGRRCARHHTRLKRGARGTDVGMMRHGAARDGGAAARLTVRG
jgi:hypothetical protein